MKEKHTTFDVILIAIAVIYDMILASLAFLWLFTGLLDGCKGVLYSTNHDVLTIREKLFAVFAAGVLGGTFYCLRSVYQRLGEAYPSAKTVKKEEMRDPTLVFNIKVWIFWYLYRPLQAGILAMVVICLFSSGILSISNITNENLAQLYFQVSLGFLIGYGTHEVVNKIEEIIKVLFAKGKGEGELTVEQKTAKKVKENQPVKA